MGGEGNWRRYGRCCWARAGWRFRRPRCCRWPPADPACTLRYMPTRQRRRVVVDDSALARGIGARLKAARLKADLTQQQLAGDRYTKAYVSALEHGHVKPSMAALNFLSTRLGVTAHALFTDEAEGWTRLRAGPRGAPRPPRSSRVWTVPWMRPWRATGWPPPSASWTTRAKPGRSSKASWRRSVAVSRASRGSSCGA